MDNIRKKPAYTLSADHQECERVQAHRHMTSSHLVEPEETELKCVRYNSMEITE